MKKILLISLFVASVASSKAQFVTIPDPDFRGWLSTHGYSSRLNGNLMDTTNQLNSLPGLPGSLHDQNKLNLSKINKYL